MKFVVAKLIGLMLS